MRLFKSFHLLNHMIHFPLLLSKGTYDLDIHGWSKPVVQFWLVGASAPPILDPIFVVGLNRMFTAAILDLEKSPVLTGWIGTGGAIRIWKKAHGPICSRDPEVNESTACGSRRPPTSAGSKRCPAPRRSRPCRTGSPRSSLLGLSRLGFGLGFGLLAICFWNGGRA